MRCLAIVSTSCFFMAMLSTALASGQHIAASPAKPQVQPPALSPQSSGSALNAGPTRGGEKSSLIVTKEYIIGPEDLLEITVWRNADLSKTVIVRPDGRISLPLVGDVTAVGKTPSQLTEEIATRLKEYK